MKQRDITAAIYLRLSRDDGGDSESNSISNQREILNRYAIENGFIVKNEYVDDGYSGTHFDRPSLKRMTEEIEAGEIGVLLIKDLSRLGRNNALIAFWTEIFLPDNDVRLIALGDNIDTLSDIDSWVRLIEEKSSIEDLDRETLKALIDKIEIGEKEVVDAERRQDVRIYYKFVGLVN